MLDADHLFDFAEDIFFELAPENLNEAKINLLQNNPQAFFVEINEGFASSWSELIYEEPDPSEYLELSFYLDLGRKQESLALMLIGLDTEHDKECHVQW